MSAVGKGWLFVYSRFCNGLNAGEFLLSLALMLFDKYPNKGDTHKKDYKHP